MAPYVEELIGYKAKIGESSFGGKWKKVLGTEHETNEDSLVAKNAHTLIKNIFTYREVEDDLGPPCDGCDQSAMLEKV